MIYEVCCTYFVKWLGMECFRSAREQFGKEKTREYLFFNGYRDSVRQDFFPSKQIEPWKNKWLNVIWALFKLTVLGY